MTTDQQPCRVIAAPDLFQPNDCVNLPRPEGDLYPPLAAATFLRFAEPATREETRWHCVEQAVEYIVRILGSHSLWLCAGHRNVDNRVTQHQKLWGALQKKGLDVGSTPSLELRIETGDGYVTYVGGVQLGKVEFARAANIVGPSSRSFLVALPEGQSPSIERYVAAGWLAGFSRMEELRDLAFVIVEQGGVLFRLFGEFDDREVGVDCIVGAEVFEVLFGNGSVLGQ